MVIAIYGNRHQGDNIDKIIEVVSQLVNAGDTIVMHNKLARHIGDLRPEVASLLESVEINDSICPAQADVAVSIGGDGTFLRTTQWVGDHETPIIGVNTGHLGFLAPFTLDDVAGAIEMFRRGEARLQSRTLLCVDIEGLDQTVWPYALNEVVISKRDNASMVTVSARIDNSRLADYLCDGLIVATPTGSTAYNLSVGGPIVAPEAPNLVISPIAAHTLTMRPLVVGDESVLELRVNSRGKSFRLSLDGRSLTLPCGVPMYVSKAQFVVNIVLKPDHNFYKALRDKLLWGQTVIGQ